MLARTSLAFILVVVLGSCWTEDQSTTTTTTTTGTSTTSTTTTTKPKDKDEICFKELGCVETGKEWFHKTYRPTNPPPLSRHSIKTAFIVYTKDNLDKNGNPKGDIMLIGDKDIKCSQIQESLDTKIIIHDFTSSGEAGWMKRFIKAMFKKANWNMIVVDWESGAAPPFPQAASNARVVALEICYLLDTLKSTSSLVMKDVHLIGHGLGAHIAGYVGENIRGLGRITGLDPTGPYFEGMPPCVTLDPTDAIFVDVIHTDGTDEEKGVYGRQGELQPLGHVDFYPNGGTPQPGCLVNNSFPSLMGLTRNSLKPGQIYPGCSHKRASKYFTETISNLNCPFIAFPCKNYLEFAEGKCLSCNGDQCSVMGLMADAYRKDDQVNIKLYLNTGSEPFFCWYPYRIVIALAATPLAKPRVEGYLTATIHQKNRTIDMLLTPGSNTRVMEHGDNVTFLVYHPVRLGIPDQVDLHWVYKSSIGHTSTVCFLGLCNDHLYVANVTITKLGFYPPRNESTFFCNLGQNFTEIAHKKSASFFKCPPRSGGGGKQKKRDGGGELVRVRKAADHWYYY